VECLVHAGDRASVVLGYEEAAVQLRRALELLGAAGGGSGERRGNLLLRLGDAQWRADDGTGALLSFERAIDGARRSADPELLARAALGYVTALGGFLLYARFPVGSTAAGLLEEALAALPAGDSALRAHLLAYTTLHLPLRPDARDPLVAGPAGRALDRDPRSRRAVPVDPALARRARHRRARRRGDGAARAGAPRRAGLRRPARGGLWILHLCSLAEACVLVGDERRALQLYELLLPHAGDNAVSYSRQSFGPVARRLGKLAALLGRWADADRHFATALERCEQLCARAIRARVLLEHARALAARGEGGDRARIDAMLDEAARLCVELGMTGLLGRVSALRGQAPAAPSPWMRSSAARASSGRSPTRVRRSACAT